MSRFKVYFKSILIPVIIGFIIGIITSSAISYGLLESKSLIDNKILQGK